MSDLQVLELSIRDNANQTASALDGLVGALGKVRSAVSGGLGMSGVTEALRSLNLNANKARTAADGIAAIGRAINTARTSLSKGLDTSGIVGSIERLTNLDASGIQTLGAHITELTGKINELSAVGTALGLDGINQQLNELSAQVGNAARSAANLETLAQTFRTFAGVANMGINSDALAQGFAALANAINSNPVNDGIISAMQNYASALSDAAYNAERLATALEYIKNEVPGGANALRDAAEAADKMVPAANAAGDAIQEMGEEAGFTGIGLKGMLGTIWSLKGSIFGLVQSFGRVAKMRLFRYVLRQIVSAFKEGLENVREYSKAIGGLYAKDMQNLDNQILKLKNSLGAALAPAIQAMLPLINQVVNGLIWVANAINMVFAALNGSPTWTMAIDTIAESTENAGNAAGAAHKQMKNLLADWDELNIIQSESGGGGGGGSSGNQRDYLSMFTENPEFAPWVQTVKDIVEYFEEHIPLVHGMIAALIASLLGFNGASIGVVLGLAVSFSAGLDMGKYGATEQNWESAILGALTTAFSGGILGLVAGGLTGGAIGAITGLVLSLAVTLLVAFSIDDDFMTKQFRTMTDDEIDKFVRTQMFTFDVQAQVNLLNTKLANVDRARQDLEADAAEAFTALEVLKLGVDNEATLNGLRNAVIGENGNGGLIDSIITLLNEKLRLFEGTVSIAPLFNANGENISGEVLASVEIGVMGVQQYVSGLGKQLGEEFTKGFTDDGLANFDTDLVKDLTQKLLNVENAMGYAKAGQEGMFSLEQQLSGLNEYDVQGILEAYRQYKSDLDLAIRRSYFESESLLAQLEAAYRQMAVDAANPEDAAKYNAMADEYQARHSEMVANREDNVKTNVDSQSAVGRERIREATLNALSSVMAATMQGRVTGGKSVPIMQWNGFGATGGEGSLLAALINYTTTVMTAEHGDDIIKDNAMQKSVADALATGVITWSDLIDPTMLANYIVESATNPLNGQLNEELAADLSRQWQELGGGDLWETILAIAARNAEASLVTPLKDKNTVKQLLDVGQPVPGGFFVEPPQEGTGVSFDLNDLDLSNKAIYEARQNTQALEENLKKAEEILNRVDTTGYTVDVKVNFTTNGFSVSPSGGSGGSSGNFLMNLLNFVKPHGFASGGFPDVGEMFVANENGPELIGRIGNRSAVANADQIVMGVANGVAAGQAEQNSLLRQQNQLLTQMLNKKFMAEAVPSPEWGRFVQRSVQQWQGMAGTT